MTRRPAIMLATATALAALAASVFALHAAPAPGAAGVPARMQVSATEFRLTFSRLKVRAGRVRIELVNYGEDSHDLMLRHFGGSRTFTIPETAPGERTTRTFRLRKGRYHVWCGVADHRGLGMHAVLRVVKRS